MTMHAKDYPISLSAAIINSHRVPNTGASALISISERDIKDKMQKGG